MPSSAARRATASERRPEIHATTMPDRSSIFNPSPSTTANDFHSAPPTPRKMRPSGSTPSTSHDRKRIALARCRVSLVAGATLDHIRPEQVVHVKRTDEPAGIIDDEELHALR